LAANSPRVLRVAVEAPQHSGLGVPLDYLSDRPLPAGSLVRVPLGQRELLGIVWPGEAAALPGIELRPLASVITSLPPLPAAWCALIEFAAGYYQRSVGELALSVLPPELRKLSDAQLAKRRTLTASRPSAPPISSARATTA